MRKMLLIITAGLFIFGFMACEESGDELTFLDEAVSLGSTLTLDGTVDRNTPSLDTIPWVSDFNNDSNAYAYFLVNESDETIFDTDSGDGSLDKYEVNFVYNGTIHLSHLFPVTDWSGISSTDSTVQFVIIKIVIGNIGSYFGDVVNSDLSDSSIRQYYYYLYSTALTVLDGTYTDGSSDNHIYNQIKISEGWNRLLVETSDMTDFTYSGGTITDPHWTFIGAQFWP